MRDEISLGIEKMVDRALSESRIRVRKPTELAWHEADYSGRLKDHIKVTPPAVET